jgi:hypothetical protein
MRPDVNIQYCTNCGSATEIRIPLGDERARHVCTACGMIHYQNPKVVVGCIPEYEYCIPRH